MTVTVAAVSKTYDGTATATVTLSDNRVSGDVLADNYTSANFADKNVGMAKTVSVSGISISGTDAGNYSYNTSATTTADITPAPLTVINTQAGSRTYDGTTTTALTGATLQPGPNR